MKHLKIIYYILLVGSVSLFSFCSNNNKNDNNSAYETIRIDVEKSERIVLRNIFDSIQLIPLSTVNESLISECSKVVKHENKYYILDYTQNILFVFDENGKFLFNTKKFQGEGPGEYIHISDFNINEYTQNLETLDPFRQKIHIWDMQLNSIIKSISFPKDLLPVDGFYPIAKEKYIIATNKKEIGYLLAFFDAKNNEIEGYAAHQNPKFTNTFRSYFSKFNNSLRFNYREPLRELYSINKEKMSIEKIQEIDFGKYNFNIDDFSEKELASRNFFVDKSNQYAFMFDRKENQKYLFLYFFVKKKMNIAILNKEKNTIDIYYNGMPEQSQLPPPDLIDEEALYYFCQADAIEYIVTPNNRSLVKHNSKKYLYNIKSDDNPIIVKYILK